MSARNIIARRHPLRVYALLELGIGAIGLAVLFGMPHVEEVYTRYFQEARHAA